MDASYSFHIDPRKLKDGSLRRAFLREFTIQEFSRLSSLGFQTIRVSEEEWPLRLLPPITPLRLLHSNKVLVSFQEYRTINGFQRVAIPRILG
jgi:hypothetical protein